MDSLSNTEKCVCIPTLYTCPKCANVSQQKKRSNDCSMIHGNDNMLFPIHCPNCMLKSFLEIGKEEEDKGKSCSIIKAVGKGYEYSWKVFLNKGELVGL